MAVTTFELAWYYATNAHQLWCHMDTEQPKPKRRKNAAEKRALRAEQLRLFAKQVGRKAQKNTEPNDRKHDREVERTVKKMDPAEFDRLLRDGDDE